MAKVLHLSVFSVCVLILQTVITSAAVLDSNITDVCSQPIEIGTCRAFIPSYGFDSTEKKCVKFEYGGCHGNGNRFTELKDCQDACEECSQPIDQGPCFGSIEKYAFNAKEKKCEQFTYGGCMGNKNRFTDLEDCEKKCM